MANRLRELRKQRGLSQEQLGELVNATKMQVSRHEKERRGLKLEKLIDYAGALGCHPAELFVEPWAIDQDEIMFINVYRDLDPLQQELLVRMVAAFIVRGDEPSQQDDDSAAAAQAG